MTVRPSLAAIWPSFTLFPLAGLAVLSFGVLSGDGIMVLIGTGLLALNLAMVLNYAYFTRVGIEGDELVHRTQFGMQIERVSLGAVQRIDAKRYPGAHSGVSAPHFVVRGRDSTVKVNTKPYRLSAFVPLLEHLRGVNAQVELDPFWEAVARGEDVSKEVALTPRSRM